MKQDRSFFQQTLSTMVVMNFLYIAPIFNLRNGKREKLSSSLQNVIRGASFSNRWKILISREGWGTTFQPNLGYLSCMTVFEIKVPKMVHPAICSCASHYISRRNIKAYLKVEKSMHTPGAHVSKSMHPAAKMCTQGAGCTLNFGHCMTI